MISLELPDNMEKMRSNIRNLAKGVLRPVSRKYDEAEHEYPKELEVFRGMQIMGRPKKKKKDGEIKSKSSAPKTGVNLGTCITVEQMCWADAALLLSLPNAGLGNAAIAAVATDEQLEKFGKKWIAMAITEPASGSDSGSIRTSAKPDGDHWIINGEKIFVTCAERCEAVVVWATVDKSAGKAGIKPFIVEKGTPGFSVEKLENKLGIRGSDTGTLLFDDCRIPRENILGVADVKNQTEGFKGVMKTFDNTRPMVASMALGITSAVLEFTKEKMAENSMELNYSKNTNCVSSMEKEVYMMEAHLEASRLLTWKAAWMADNDQFNNLEASMSKAKAGRSGTLTAQKCCELLGPMGFSRKYLAEKWMRDIKIMDIFEGTGQIQHLIIARHVLGLSSSELK